MDIEALRSFVAFVDTGSFTRAAKQTFRTQSAVSMQMKKLEEETGHTLFEKEGRNLILTGQGRSLASYARRILSIHDQAISEFSSSDRLPPLTIGCPDDYAESVLPDLIVAIKAEQPALNIRIRCESSAILNRWLDSGEVDIAILTRSPERDEGYLLKHDRGVWVHGGFPELADDGSLPLVLYEHDCRFHSTAIDGLEKQGREYRLMAHSSSATAIKSLLKKGVGISAMASSSVSSGIEIFERKDLPVLPAVDIVLAVAPIPHPLFGTALAARMSSRLMKQV